MKSRGGYLIAHRAVMSHLVQQNNFGFEIEIQKQRIGDQWKLFKNPQTGISFLFQDFGYRDVLGQAFGVYQHYSQPLIASEKDWLDLKFGSGLAIINRKYDAIDNPKNNAISSYLNAMVDIQLSWEHHFGKWHLGAGIGITHYSNAAIVRPNLGLNTPYLDLTVGYNLGERLRSKKLEKEEVAEYDPLKTTIGLSLIGSVKQNKAGANLPKPYGIVGLRPYVSFGLGPRMKWDSGLDITYNEANRHIDDGPTPSAGSNLQAGVFVGPVFRMNRTEVYIHFGAYFLNQLNVAGWIYNRIGYRYLFSSKWYGLVNIKAHFGKADYIELGIGYRLWD